ncbi:hypothetical protein [Aureimonas psammosilenae]|uniref:hypothetical protein n=1 Tax=Aureimonas psammosilenae TaxID=2495496 RepID=UPI0012612EDE|nr:hypothetical protein [Aureimonas psammosilenae]
MNLQDLNSAHRCMMRQLHRHCGEENFAEDILTLLAGMAAETINNLAKPGHEDALASAFSRLIQEQMESMAKERIP